MKCENCNSTNTMRVQNKEHSATTKASHIYHKMLKDAPTLVEVDLCLLRKNAKIFDDAPDEYEWERGWNAFIDYLKQKHGKLYAIKK